MPELQIQLDGLAIACVEAGPADGPLALCLHGFPDTAHTWRHLLPELARQGYRAVAPFQRGAAPSGLPADGRYQVGALARDANDVHRALGGDSRAVLIGHDWGALAAYGALGAEPQNWRRAVTVAVPPPSAIGPGFFGYDQLKRSWYTFFFQSPLADAALPMDGYAFYDRLWADWSPNYDATWDLMRVKESIGTPERSSAAITYYRALYDTGLHDPALAVEQAAGLGPVSQPVLYVHGSADGCFGMEAIGDVLGTLGTGSQHVVVEGAGHFVHLERPGEFARLVLGFLDR